MLIADIALISSNSSDLSNPRPDVDFVSAWTISPINLRDGADLNSDVMMVIPDFNYVYVIGRTDDNRWLQVQYQGEVGWIVSHLVRIFNADWTATIPLQ